MPDYTIRDPQTGRTVTLRGDSPPTEQELEQVFASLPAVNSAEPEERARPETLGENLAYLGRTIANVPGSAFRAGRGMVAGAAQLASQIGGAPYDVAEAMDRGESFGEAVSGAPIVQTARQFIPATVAHYRERYATPEDRARTIRDDPVGMALDVAPIAGAITAAQRGAAQLSSSLQNRNPATRSAVAFAERQGIPVDLATASGNRAVRGVQRLADESIGGSVVAERAAASTAEAMTQAGGRLAQRAAPAAATAETAGAGVQQALTTRISDLSDDATRAYGQLRQLEASQAQRIQQAGGVQAPPGATRPFTRVPMAVNLGPTRTALRPIYEALQQENQLVPFISGSDKGRALVALDRLMKAPDQAPLSVADAALGELKGLARVDDAFRRTAGQGVAAEAVKRLDAQVMAAAQRAGPQAVRALQEGRRATVAKYDAIDVVNRLVGRGATDASEPVRLVNRLTANQDAAITLLRDVQRVAPNEMPAVGRAVIEGLLEKATAEGGFSRAQGLLADWQKLGAGTKRILFRDPALVRDLDDFFLLAKRMADNPNPSGSGMWVTRAGELGLWFTNPATGAAVSASGAGLALLLRNPRAVRALTRGMQVPARNRAASAAASANLIRIAEELGVPLVPALAEEPVAAGAGPR